MIYRLLILLISILFMSCENTTKSSIEDLFEVDKQFSARAGEIGFNKAFVEFAHDDAIILRDNSMPIVGKTAITKLYKNVSSDGVQFSWEPLSGDISKSGDLGFTYGTYTFIKESEINEGTYVSVWKKDKSGRWKYILDSGNEGLKPE